MDLICFEDKYIPVDKIIHFEIVCTTDIYIKMVLTEKITLLEYFNNVEDAQDKMIDLLAELKGDK